MPGGHTHNLLGHGDRQIRIEELLAGDSPLLGIDEYAPEHESALGVDRDTREPRRAHHARQLVRCAHQVQSVQLAKVGTIDHA